MKESKLRVSLVAAASLAIFAMTGSALAGTNDSGPSDPSLNVSYEDLNLDNEKGVEALYARLRQASEKACGVKTVVEAGSVQRVMQSKACYRETLSSAVAWFHNPELEALHTS